MHLRIYLSIRINSLILSASDDESGNLYCGHRPLQAASSSSFTSFAKGKFFKKESTEDVITFGFSMHGWPRSLNGALLAS